MPFGYRALVGCLCLDERVWGLGFRVVYQNRDIRSIAVRIGCKAGVGQLLVER